MKFSLSMSFLDIWGQKLATKGQNLNYSKSWSGEFQPERTWTVVANDNCNMPENWDFISSAKQLLVDSCKRKAKVSASQEPARHTF